MVQESVFGLFATGEELEHAVRHLLLSGIPRENISFVAPRRDETSEAAPDNLPSADAEKGAAIGALSGLMLGLADLSLPAIGAFVAGGWILTSIVGAGIGAIVGGLLGVLAELGVPHEHRERYESALQRGASMVSVRVDPLSAPRVARMLEQDGASHVRTSGEHERQAA